MRVPAFMLVPALTLALSACAEMKADGPAAVAEGRTCGADARQDWVGQSVAVLNDVALPEGTRVLFPGAAMTMDYREDRLNVEVDRSDGIARVYCG